MAPRPEKVQEFIWPVTVYWEDTDAAGLVYHANYLKFMERARSEWITRLGFDQSALLRDPGVIFPIHRVELNYLRPVGLGEHLDVVCRLVELRPASMHFSQSIRRRDGAEVCRGEVSVVCVGARSRRPRRIPAAIVSELRYDR